MSLDVYLRGKQENVLCTCPDCGNEHTREQAEEFYCENITHNLGRMAEEAGIYMHVWRPDDLGLTRAVQLIEALRKGIALLESDPARFMKLDDPGGWGTYRQFVPWLKSYLAACEEHPDALVYVSR
jgi:hypothetical protein